MSPGSGLQAIYVGSSGFRNELKVFVSGVNRVKSGIRRHEEFSCCTGPAGVGQLLELDSAQQLDTGESRPSTGIDFFKKCLFSVVAGHYD